MDTFPEGQHEPVNTIISGDSDAEVLANSVDNGGILNYFLCVFPPSPLLYIALTLGNLFRSLHFGTECLNQHIGNSQKANLGDGNGSCTHTSLFRATSFKR